MKIVYGPVPSWPIGRSLGVDALGGTQKRCTFDCTYCQLGPTPPGPVMREVWVTPADLADELWTTRDVPADYITFSGMGEPTLAANLAELIQVVHEIRTSPVAVLTNACLLNAPSIQVALRGADYVIAKLDAGDEEMFLRVNRPRIPCSLAEIIEGIRTFRQGFVGRLALQIMFIAANVAQAEVLAALVRWLRPDEVQLNTPLRPSPTPPLSRPEMGAIIRAFERLPAVQVYGAHVPQVAALEVQSTARRRPERLGSESLVPPGNTAPGRDAVSAARPEMCGR